MEVNKGTESLARFVCAMELYTVRLGKRSVSESYALAFGCPLASARKNAYGTSGLKHPAVATLLTGLRQQSQEIVWGRLQYKYSRLLEAMADSALKHDASVTERYYAAQALQKFASLVKLDEVQQRQERRIAAGAHARSRLTPIVEHGELSEQNAGMLIGLIRDQLGEEKLRELIGEEKKALPA